MTVNVSKPAINVREKLAELDKPTGIAGEAMLRAETPQEQFNLIGAGRRNLIINGDMQIDQRGGSTGIVTSGFYACDRFRFALTSMGEWSCSQSTDAPNGFSNSLKLDCTTAQTSPPASSWLLIEYKFEGYDVQQLAKGTSDALPVTLSFWCKSNKAGDITVDLNDTDNTRGVGSVVTINSANTWEYKTITFPPDTTGAFNNDNTQSLRVEMWLDAGSNYRGGTVPTAWESVYNADRAAGTTLNLADSTSNEFYITGVQLELGKVATPFEHRSYGEELALCQRYYQKSYDIDSFAGDNDGNGAIAFIPVSTQDYVNTNFPISMRASPNITVYRKNGGATNQAQRADNAAAYLDVTVADISTRGFSVTPATAVSNSHYRFHYLADAEL
jgi:hypothetical protein